MPEMMFRQTQSFTGTLSDILASCSPMPIGQSAAISILIPAGTSPNTITWHASSEGSGTYLPIEKMAGGALQTNIAASVAYVGPVELYAFAFVKAKLTTPATITCIWTAKS